MIKSSKVSLKFTNESKRQTIASIVCEYRNVMKKTIDFYWEYETLPKFAEKDFTATVDSWLSARMIQCATKQAIAIVKGTQTKQKKRMCVINKLEKENSIEKANKLRKVYERNMPTKPVLDNVNLELDSRFVVIELENNTSFDGYITLQSIGSKIKIELPFKRHKHFNGLLTRGILKNSIRLNEKEITMLFEIEPTRNNGTEILGIDIGAKTLISCSDSQVSKIDNHGHDLDSIMKKLSRQRKGSKAFGRTQEHRTNYVNWAINQLNLSNCKELKIENIKDMRKGKTSSRFLSHFTYPEIFDKIEAKCEELDVLVTHITPTYTSQRCSVCGWTKKANRKVKVFDCDKCGHLDDADLNAAKNIASPLRAITPNLRRKQRNRTGFYWLTSEQAHIVPVVQKDKIYYFI